MLPSLKKIASLGSLSYLNYNSFHTISHQGNIKFVGNYFCDYIEKINFKSQRNFLEIELSSISEKKTFVQNHIRCSKIVNPDVTLDLLLITIFSEKSGKNIQDITNRKILQSITFMEIAQLHEAGKLLIHILSKYNNIMELNQLHKTIVQHINHKMTSSTIPERFQLASIFHIIYGNNLKNTKTLDRFIKYFHFNYESYSTTQKVQLLYYAAFNKNVHGNFVKRIINCFTEEIWENELNKIEKSIICDSALKSSSFLNINALNHIDKILQKDLKENEAVYGGNSIRNIAMIKILCRSRYFSYGILEAIKICIANQRNLSPDFANNLLSYLAYNKYYDEEILKWFEKYILQSIKTPNTIKISDIDIALHILSTLSFNCSDEFGNIIINYLKESGKLSTEYHGIVRILYSLVQLGIDPGNLATSILSTATFESITGNNIGEIKRIRIIYECLKDKANIKNPEYSMVNIPQKSVLSVLYDRPAMKEIDNLNNYLRNCNIPSPFSFKYLVNSIEICTVIVNADIAVELRATNSVLGCKMANILSQMKGNVCFDINDSSTVLRNMNVPHGEELCKRKIIKARGWKLSVFNEIDICGKSDKDNLILDILNSIICNLNSNEQEMSIS